MPCFFSVDGVSFCHIHDSVWYLPWYHGALSSSHGGRQDPVVQRKGDF